MKDIEFIYLNQSDIRATGVSMETALEAVEDAFRLHYQGQGNRGNYHRFRLLQGVRHMRVCVSQGGNKDGIGAGGIETMARDVSRGGFHED